MLAAVHRIRKAPKPSIVTPARSQRFLLAPFPRERSSASTASTSAALPVCTVMAKNSSTGNQTGSQRSRAPAAGVLFRAAAPCSAAGTGRVFFSFMVIPPITREAPGSMFKSVYHYITVFPACPPPGPERNLKFLPLVRRICTTLCNIPPFIGGSLLP